MRFCPMQFTPTTRVLYYTRCRYSFERLFFVIFVMIISCEIRKGAVQSVVRVIRGLRIKTIVGSIPMTLIFRGYC